MRTLEFIVEGQTIKKSPSCNFDGLVPGTDGYLQAKFSFSKEWNGTARVVGFWTNRQECPPKILKDGRTCMIPAEALVNKRFELQVLGKREDLVISTNKIEIVQNGGR